MAGASPFMNQVREAIRRKGVAYATEKVTAPRKTPYYW